MMNIMNNSVPSAIIEAARQIQLIVFDIDGTLTDGQMYYSSDGDDLIAFNAHDGYALRVVRRAGLRLAVMSGRSSQAVQQRMQSLGITQVYLGIQDKRSALLELLEQLQIEASQLCYVGDDWIDLPGIEIAGLGVAVANAVPAVLQAADWCTAADGGKGAAREVIELILQAQQRMHYFHPESAAEACADAG